MAVRAGLLAAALLAAAVRADGVPISVTVSAVGLSIAVAAALAC